MYVGFFTNYIILCPETQGVKLPRGKCKNPRGNLINISFGGIFPKIPAF